MNYIHQPKVSVCMLAFNNSNYVEQAINSVIFQKVNFSVELVIGEDVSTDDVAEKIKKYNDSDWLTIRAKFNKKNIGLIKNMAQTISSCRGEYIAWLDNDDYWVDPFKLQKQVDFLEKNKKYAICYHPVNLLVKNKIKPDVIRKPESTSNIYDLAKGNYIRSCSIVFRSSALDGFPAEYFSSTVNDYFILMLVARNGLIKRLDDVMSVYRIHAASEWSSRSDQDLKILDYLECMIGLFDSEVQALLIARHQRTSFNSMIHRLGEPELNSKIQRCLKYGDEFIQSRLLELISPKNKYSKMLFSDFRSIISRIKCLIAKKL